MRVFVIKLLSAVVGIGGLFLSSLLSISPLHVDDFYVKFSSPKSKSLALGSSRCLQGFVPEVWGQQVFNFGFTMANSPYGLLYECALEKKIIQSNEGELILEVNPVTISYYFQENEDENELKFKEVKHHLNDMFCFNLSPNVEYLFKKYEGPLVKLWTNSVQGRKIVHSDGWLEVDVDSESLQNLREEKIRAGISAYKKAFSGMKLSKKRMASIQRILEKYKSTKQIYLVRFPISSEMLALENLYAPNFNVLMGELATKHEVTYIDMSHRGEEFLTNDQHHLNRYYARLFTQELRRTVESLKKREN